MYEAILYLTRPFSLLSLTYLQMKDNIYLQNTVAASVVDNYDINVLILTYRLLSN